MFVLYTLNILMRYYKCSKLKKEPLVYDTPHIVRPIENDNIAK